MKSFYNIEKSNIKGKQGVNKMSISNADDIIDSRDVIERIEELEAELAEYENPEGELEAHDDMLKAKEELNKLKELAEEAEDYAADWLYGETLIRDSYFGDYAMQLAYDIGAIDPNATWPANCIDWDQAASQLQMDYTSVDFDGVTFWIR